MFQNKLNNTTPRRIERLNMRVYAKSRRTGRPLRGLAWSLMALAMAYSSWNSMKPQPLNSPLSRFWKRTYRRTNKQTM